MQLHRHAWAVGLAVGPSVAYLAWALQRRRYGHALLAISLWAAVWFAGPTFVIDTLSMCIRHLHGR